MVPTNRQNQLVESITPINNKIFPSILDEYVHSNCVSVQDMLEIIIL